MKQLFLVAGLLLFLVVVSLGGATPTDTYAENNISQSDDERNNWKPAPGPRPTPPDEIPEFASIAIPVCMVLGLFYFFTRKEGK